MKTITAALVLYTWGCVRCSSPATFLMPCWIWIPPPGSMCSCSDEPLSRDDVGLLRLARVKAPLQEHLFIISHRQAIPEDSLILRVCDLPRQHPSSLQHMCAVAKVYHPDQVLQKGFAWEVKSSELCLTLSADHQNVPAPVGQGFCQR